MLSANIVYIIVTRFWKSLPGGYWCILLAPLLEGSFGGMPACLVAFVSYCGDTTPERKRCTHPVWPDYLCTLTRCRSRILAINFGLYWTGISCGPLIASLAMRATDNIISVFYTAIFMQAAFLLYTRLLIVEPLSKEQQRQARRNFELHHEQDRRALADRGIFGKLINPFLPIVRPLSVLKPVKKAGVNPSDRPRKDWNLLLAALSLGCLFIIAVSGASVCTHPTPINGFQSDLPFKFQYASAAFGWGAKEVCHNHFYLAMLWRADRRLERILPECTVVHPRCIPHDGPARYAAY